MTERLVEAGADRERIVEAHNWAPGGLEVQFRNAKSGNQNHSPLRPSSPLRPFPSFGRETIFRHVGTFVPLPSSNLMAGPDD